MTYSESTARLVATHSAVAAEISSLRGLGGVLAWMKGKGLALADVDIVQQDEFSLDFVIPLLPDQQYLVFGIT
jgi:hypothetical protein